VMMIMEGDVEWRAAPPLHYHFTATPYPQPQLSPQSKRGRHRGMDSQARGSGRWLVASGRLHVL